LDRGGRVAAAKATDINLRGMSGPHWQILHPQRRLCDWEARSQMNCG